MKDKVLAYFGAERAEKIEKACPGAMESACKQVARVGEGAKDEVLVLKAAHRALQLAGSAPGFADINALRQAQGLPVLGQPKSRGQRLAEEAAAKAADLRAEEKTEASVKAAKKKPASVTDAPES